MSTFSTIAGQKAALTEEDPTQMSVAVGKAFQNYKRVIFGLLIFAFSSWQLSILDDPKRFFPSHPENPPYASEKARFKMSPLTAFWNILLSFMGNGLVGMSRGMKCCPKESRMEKRMRGGGRSKRPNITQRGGDEERGDILSNTSLTWGDDEWKPFDIYSNKIGWPYDEMYISPVISFGYWLGRSQMLSWMIPRQIFQAILLILANFTIAPKTKKGKTDSSFLWFTRFIVTLILPFVLVFSLAASIVVAVISTIWGGFFQHIFDGNFVGFLWGFFLTWILIIYNVIVQPLELLFSLFTIPFFGGGKNFVKENFSSWHRQGDKPAGYKQIISFVLTITIMAISFNSFSPMIIGT
jgi:hypothetical protein|tara:strand:- start:3216 stop:4274 length:1059 start_codon:yes stop_codon:yes gene_type:complete